ncbi:glycosyl transferase [Roseivirga sp.]|uniref:glycosyl transferase n=1 Tax=Roseivirga sp. TaxID=1964215 RepID=UPI003B8B7EB7
MNDEKRKRILVITYYWPPSGGAGVQRWLKFTKYLPEFGWDPIVFTPESPDFDLKDESLLSDVSDQIEILKFPIWEPYKIFKKVTGNKTIKQGQILEEGKTSLLKRMAIWLRGNLFVPDPRIYWVKPSVEYLSSIIQSNDIKHIITTGPPHSVHLIGKGLKLKNPTLTWVADFRDPWSGWDILKKMNISSFIWKKHLRLEESVLKMSDAVLATGPTAASEFRRLGARKVHYITNGFDQEDIKTEVAKSQNNKFVISHLGMLSVDRNPIALWGVLEKLCAQRDFHQAFELHLTGILSPEVLQTIRNHKLLSEKLIVKDSIPHREVFQSYLDSEVLLLLQTRTGQVNSQLPGKLFEYLSVKRPILAIGSKENDIASILNETRSGQSFNYGDKDRLRDFILKAYTAWKNEETHWNFKNTDKYERRNLTSELSSWLESIN